MKIFLIADIHHGKNANYSTLKGLEFVNVFGTQFQKLIPLLKLEMEACDLVVNLGDFIQDENSERDIEAYKEAMFLLSTKTTTKHVVGNHDVRNLSKETLASLIRESRCFYSFDMGEYHHVVLDGTRNEPRGSNTISEEQILWLEDDLKMTHYKTIVYCHFPLDRQNMDDNYYFKDNPELASVNNKFFIRKVLQKSRNVLAVFSGHTHFYSKQEIDGIVYFTIPSFTENDGNHNPKAEYGIAIIEDESVTLEIKKVKTVE